MLSRIAVTAALFVLVNGGTFSQTFHDRWGNTSSVVPKYHDLLEPIVPSSQSVKGDREQSNIVMPPRPAQLELDKPVRSSAPRRARRHAPFDHPFDYPPDMDFLRNRAWT